MNELSGPLMFFSALVLASTVAIVLAVVVAYWTLRHVPEPWPRRLAMATLVPWGALEAWRRGHRALALSFAVALLAYVVLRVSAEAITWA